MACNYLYQGKKYSRVGVLKLIASGQIDAPLDETQARQWLNDKLGLADDQVSVVKGLLDNGAYGRFLSDGKLLMSADLDGVQYHEAFHRIFRMFLTPEQQQQIIDEFMSRPDAQRTIDNIAKRYPDESIATRVEEAIAEEFMYYMLNNGNYPVPEQSKSFFDMVIDLFRRLLGMSDKLTIKELYDTIKTGKYKGVKPVTYEVDQADMVFLEDGTGLTVEQKNEIMSFMMMSVIEQLTDSDVLYDFIDGNLPKDTFSTTVVQSIIDILSPRTEDGEGGYDLYNTNQELALSIVGDMFGDVEELTYSTPMRTESKLLKAFTEYAAQYSLKLSFVDGDNTVKTQEEIDDVSNEENQIGDNAFMNVSFEYDPRGNLNKGVKLMMASIPDINSEGKVHTSATLNIPKAVSYNEATKIVYNTLAGIPNTYEDVIEALRVKSNDFPFLNYIIQRLVEDTSMRLRGDFMAGFVKNRYTFVKSYIGKGENRFINISNASQGGKYVQLWKNRMEVAGHDAATLATQLRGTRDIATLATLMGFDELNDLGLLEDTFDDDTKETVAQRLNAIASVAANALDADVKPNDLYTYRPNDTDFSSSVRLLGEFVAEKGVPFDMLLLNSEGKRIFSISEHTYQTIISGHLNAIADSVRSISDIQKRRSTALERIKAELPHLLHIENFDGTNVRSRILKDVLDGQRINLFVMDGVDAYNSNEAHFSKIGYTDYLSQYLNNILNGNMLGFKHGDRKVVYAYKLNRPFVDQLTTDSIITDAVSLAAEYLLDEVRRIRAVENNPKLTEGLALVDKANELQHFDFIKISKIKNATTAQEIIDEVGNELTTFFNNQTDKLRVALSKSGVFDTPTHGYIEQANGKSSLIKDAGTPVGIDTEAFLKFRDANGDSVNEAIAAYTATNYFFGFIEQMKVFIGEPYNYKSFIDFYKRAQMQSSTGTSMSYGSTVEQHIQSLNNQDSFVIDGVERTYGIGDLTRPGYMSEVVVYDQQFDSASAVELNYESPIDGSKVSMVQYLTEKGVMMETGNEALARQRALSNVETMKNYDENDGISYINMFMWRSYSIRSKSWSPQKENTFQIELAALQTDNIADTVVYVDSRYKDRFYANERPGTTAVRIFDVKDVAEKLSPKKGAVGFMMRHTDYPTVMKPQYTGPFHPNDPLIQQDQHLNLIAGRKTAYMVLMPTTIKGTKLELMNKAMLKAGLDGKHMVTAAKYGRRAKVDGMVLYNEDGTYNEGMEDIYGDQVSYLDLKYHKDQVNVGTTPKKEIKNATQSVKTVLQNMFSGGVPVDYGTKTFTDYMDKPLTEVQDRDSGIDTIYTSTELSDIGSIEDYKSYLNEVSSSSKVNQVVYHFGSVGRNRKFSKEYFGEGEGSNVSGEGFYFADSYSTIANGGLATDYFYENPEDQILSSMVNDDVITIALLNATNPTKGGTEIKEGSDILIRTDNQGIGEYIVPESNQVYILGSKEDIQGFSKYVNSLDKGWRDLTEEQKLEASPIYQVYADYRDTLYSFVTAAADDLAKELGNTNRMVKTLRKAVRDRQEARYIVESVEAFIDNESIDTIPNSKRVENILYSIVTKGAINLYRPGNGVPQVATSLWEKPDVTRTKNDSSFTSKEQVTSFYDLNDDGSLSPAKILMPLEPDMVGQFLERFGTDNIMEALDAYEKLPDGDKFVYKSLRIPNQQFSFNDVFLVDRFTSPLMQSFVVVPSEIVPKTDADFDLDKQQLYGYARDKKGNIYNRIATQGREGALLRMKQWESITALHMVESVDELMFDHEYTYTQRKEQIIKEVKILKAVNKRLKEENDLTDPDSVINKILSEDLEIIQEYYGIEGETVSEQLDSINQELDDIAGSGIWQPERFQSLLIAKEELFGLFEDRREQRNDIVEMRKLSYKYLDKIREVVDGIRLVDFIEQYPTAEEQTHKLINHNELLQAEINLLLSPVNAHKMIDSANDAYLSTEQFARVVSRLSGVTEAKVLEDTEKYTLGDMNSGEFLSVDGNARRAVQMISSKANVGPVALSITHHNIGQVDGTQLRLEFTVNENGKDVKISSLLPLKGFIGDRSMSKVLTSDQKYILDIFSNLLTAQVDGVNNPYAPRMNISDQTLGPILMLIRRGVSVPTVLDIINNPLVRRFINARNINRSFIHTASGFSKRLGVKKGNQRLLEDFLKDKKVNKKEFDGYYYSYRNGKGSIIDPDTLQDRLGKTSFNATDSKVLAMYLLVEEQAQALLGTVTDMTPDTRPKKDRSDIVTSDKNADNVMKKGITDLSHRSGFLEPFYNNQNMYRTTYGKYYKLPHDRLDAIAERIGSHLRNEDYSKMRSKLNDDYLTFLLQNYVEGVKEYSVEGLIAGEDTFIHELSQRVETEDNYVMRMLLPILNMAVNPDGSVPIHNVKIMDQGVATVSINDMYDEFEMLDDETQQKLIATSIYQSGLSNSPFSLRSFLTVDIVDSMLQEAMTYADELNNDPGMMNVFTDMFVRNNPVFAPRNKYSAERSGHLVYAIRPADAKFFTIYDTDTGDVLTTLGNSSPAITNYKISESTNSPSSVPTDSVPVEDFTSKEVNVPIIDDSKC